MDMNEYISFLADNTFRAMIREVETAPKPGLVDRMNSGSHEDMDYETFIASAIVLKPHFRRFLEITRDSDSDLVLPLLRKPGMEAEQVMYHAAHGANTHKGLIFSMGLVAASLVRLAMKLKRRPLLADQNALVEMIRHNAKGITGELQQEDAPTHGRTVYRQHRLLGIRGEAEEGFPAVFHTGLPELRRHQARHTHPDLPALLTLMELILVTEDTNLVRRGGLTGLSWMRSRADAVLENCRGKSRRELLEELTAFDFAASQRGLSPGGAADNLALSMFLEQVLQLE